MDFAFTPEQEMLKKAIHDFAETEISPRVNWMEETNKVPMDIVEKMGKLGYMGVLIPRQYGGLGLGHVERMMVLEEIGRASPAMGNTLQVVHLGATPIMLFGNEDQKKKWLPGVARGEKLTALSVSESTGGSDVLSMQTTAKLVGGDYVINGRKCFVSNSHIAGIFGIVAKTGEGTKGLSAFVVESDTPGLRMGREENKFGLKGCNTGEIVLENCRVPKENIIGKEGDGLKVAVASISNVGRPGIAAVALGIVRACLEETVRYSKQRCLYGNPISELQAIQWNIVDMYGDYETGRLLLFYSAWLRDKGVRCDSENALAKFWNTEAAVRCAKKAIDVFGAWGCMNEYAPQRLLRDAELLISAAGTSEIMRITMLRKALEMV